MFQWKLTSFLALFYLGQCSQIIPPLYRYDEYSRCQREDHSGVYCFVKVVLNEERQNFDSPRIDTSFRHNLLDWGVCVSDCQRELANISVEERQRLFEPKFQINFTYILPADHWGTYVETLQQRYGTLVNVCVNNRLEQGYNLSQHAYSEIEYCTTREDLDSDLKRSLGLVKVAFYATVLTLIGFTVVANVVDWIGGDQARGHIIVSAFSFRRNWSRLTDQSQSELYRDFGYIDGLRVGANFYLMIVHIIMETAVIPIGNPEYSEQIVKHPLMIDTITLAITGIQFFFVIGGLLVAVTILHDMDRKPLLEDGYFRSKIRTRLIRILPVYYFCLLVTLMGDALPGVQLGPVGYKSLIQEQGRCRKQFWASALLLNNFVIFGKERCNIHGWYLSADLQLFLGSLLLLVALRKYPKRAKTILWTSGCIALIIPTAVCYFLELESAPPVSLRDGQYRLMYQPWINNIYMPSYTNMNSYLAGMIVGYLYHQTKYHNLNLDKSVLYATIKKLCLPLLAAAYLPTFVFYQYEIARSSWLTVLHNILYLNAAVIAQSVCFIECFQNPPGRIRAFLSSPPMTSLGKLVFSVYVLHLPVMRLIVNQFSPDYIVNMVNMLWIPVGVAILSYLIGFVVFFTIEQPLGSLLKHWLDGARMKIKVQ